MARGYPDPRLHGNTAAHSLGKPRQKASGSGRDGFGDALPLLLGCSRSQRGAGPSCPASSTSKMLPGWDPPAEQTQPSPRRGVPSTKAAPLSSKSPQRGGKSPVCTGVSWDPSLAQLQGCADLWGRGGSFVASSGPPDVRRTGWDLGVLGMGVEGPRAGIQDLHNTPQCRRTKGEHTPAALGVQNATTCLQ